MRSHYFTFVLIVFAACGSVSSKTNSSPDAGADESATDDSGTDPIALLACGADEDDGIDGTIDSVWKMTYDSYGFEDRVEIEMLAIAETKVIDYDYDANKNLLRYTIDREGDGNVDQVEIHTYVAGERLVSTIVDSNGDGTTDWSRTLTYNNMDQLVLDSYDNDANGIADRIDTYNYENEILASVFVDSNNDNSIEFFDYYAHDGRGNIISIKRQSPNQSLLREETRAYDANDQIILTDFDNDGNGTIDTRVTFEYTPLGELLRRDFDSGADGIIENVLESSFDELNRRTRIESRGPVAGGGYRIDYQFDCTPSNPS